MALDQAALNQIQSMLTKTIDKHTTDLEAKLTAQINNINKNNTENTEQIKQSISGLTQKIAQNTESITNVSNRVDNIESEFKNMHNRMAQLEQGPSTAEEHIINITKTNIIRQEIQEKTDNTKADITKAARKIIAITPITDEDLERNSTPTITQNDLYIGTAAEFLIKELKYTQEDCRQLDIIKVTRPRTQNTDKLYLHFATEKSAEYLQRRAITINTMYTGTDRPRANTKLFIPPQLHNRFADLSKLCYDRRQEDTEYKTRISLGEEDLVLYTKTQGGLWKNTDINALGPISPPEWHKVWPKQEMPQISSPPQGRYVTHKRTRSDDQSGAESDDPSTQENTKRHRQESPKDTKHQPTAHSTKNKDSTPAQDEQIPSILQDPCHRTVQQKIYHAEGWAKYFEKYTGNTDTNTDTATNTDTKNGGTTKGSTKTTAAPKNGKAPKDTKKVATK